MTKKLFCLLAIVITFCLLWSFYGPGNSLSMTIHGHHMTGPAGVVIGICKTVIALLVLCCVGVTLTFVFVGVGLVVFGAVAFALAMVCLPFLLPLLIPLFGIWLLCVVIRKFKTA